jgi:hypothetical protein
VSDTPTHNTANYGCPTYPHLSTCAGTPIEMTMNYMDYTDDACMYMFFRRVRRFVREQFLLQVDQELLLHLDFELILTKSLSEMKGFFVDFE